MHGRESLVIGPVIVWVGILWLGFCAFMLGWGPGDLVFDTSDQPARRPRAAPAEPHVPWSQPLGGAALRRSFDG